MNNSLGKLSKSTIKPSKKILDLFELTNNSGKIHRNMNNRASWCQEWCKNDSELIKFLYTNWNNKYLNPFISREEANIKYQNTKKIIIRLSSTCPGYLSITAKKNTKIYEERFPIISGKIIFNKRSFNLNNFTEYLNKYNDENCPLCLEKLNKNVCVLECGHRLHSKCNNNLKQKNYYKCILCKKNNTSDIIDNIVDISTNSNGICSYSKFKFY